MKLQEFFPYKLARLAETVSLATALAYEQRYNLSRDEWRVLATLAEEASMKMAALRDQIVMDKMQTSRVVARLQQSGLIDREPDPEDGRAFVISLSAAGRSLYRRIVPMALAREAFLLECLEDDERAALESMLTRLQQRADQLQSQG